MLRTTMFAQRVISELYKHKSIKIDDIYNNSEYDRSFIDSIISGMVESKYMILDLNDNGETIIKEYKGDKKLDVVDEDSNAILIDSTNKEILEYNKMRDGKILLSSGQIYFFGKYGVVLFRTSGVDSYEIVEDIIIFKTLYSIYKFRMLKNFHIDNSDFFKKEKLDELRRLKESLNR
ncbi:hypothetical protein MLC52_05250 [Sulfurimonas sp. NW15]|uniref:hypothetical protein n=1 Tax=Sulfurimonas sp. NW15 TaxID=2922729 RepID=UPI003DA8120F